MFQKFNSKIRVLASPISKEKQSLTASDFLGRNFKKHLPGICFSSNCDVKTDVENCSISAGFYSFKLWIGLNKLVLSSDKRLDKFVNYVEKWSTNIPLICTLYFLSVINELFLLLL